MFVLYFVQSGSSISDSFLYTFSVLLYPCFLNLLHFFANVLNFLNFISCQVSLIFSYFSRLHYFLFPWYPRSLFYWSTRISQKKFYVLNRRKTFLKFLEKTFVHYLNYPTCLHISFPPIKHQSNGSTGFSLVWKQLKYSFLFLVIMN